MQLFPSVVIVAVFLRQQGQLGDNLFSLLPRFVFVVVLLFLTTTGTTSRNNFFIRCKAEREVKPSACFQESAYSGIAHSAYRQRNHRKSRTKAPSTFPPHASSMKFYQQERGLSNARNRKEDVRKNSIFFLFEETKKSKMRHIIQKTLFPLHSFGVLCVILQPNRAVLSFLVHA